MSWLEQHPTISMLALVLATHAVTWLVSYIRTGAKIQEISTQMIKFEEAVMRHQQLVDTHVTNHQIHVDPVRDTIRLQRIEFGIDKLETKLEALITMLLAHQKYIEEKK